MKNFLNLTIIFIAFTIFWSCQNKSESAEEKAIRTMLEKFSQMPRNTAGMQTEMYKLERTVIIRDKNIELQLRKMNDTLPDPQSLIIIKNAEGACKAIPLFSNIYYDYWNFEFDQPIPGVEKVNTTFEKEFNLAVSTLNLNNERRLSGIVFGEMVISLLHCRIVLESDSIAISSDIFPENISHKLPVEDNDSCRIRTMKNYRAMMKEMRKGEYSFCLNSYWDEQNNRIYQWTNLWNTSDSTHLYIKLKNYRQDCNFHLLTM